MFPHTPCSIDRTFSLWLYISLFYEVNVANEKILFTIGMYSILYSMDVGNQKKNSIFMFDYFQFNYSLILIQLIWVYIQTSNGDIFVSHQHLIPLYLVCVNFLCLFVFFSSFITETMWPLQNYVLFFQRIKKNGVEKTDTI